MSESHKDSKPEVLYFGPLNIGDPRGAHCGVCYKFVSASGDRGRCIEVEGEISGPHGVCGLYVHGDPRIADPGFRLRKVSKAEAGYSEEGPTHCKNCRHMAHPELAASLCEEVEGVVAAHGCCNEWSRRAE